MISAIAGIIYISLELSEKFSNSPLATVVESTIFPVSEIAYPAITICNQNRFHKDRVVEAAKVFIPKADNETSRIFQLLVKSMNQLEFGAFDEFDKELYNFTSPLLDSLNLTEIYVFVMLRCEEIFTGKCWWRNKYVECCEEFFYLTPSEYGICYTFNSAVTTIGKEMSDNVSIHYPVRTSNYGDWSGLRVELTTRDDVAFKNDLDGVMVVVQHPDQWPNSGHFIPTGSQTGVTIKPTLSVITDDVKRMKPEEKQCLNVNFELESKKFKILTKFY